MTYEFRNSKISRGLGSSSRPTSVPSLSSSSMISLQRSMHSSQMYTPGPAISFLTCFWLFPQNEHFSRSPPSPMRATGTTPHDRAGGPSWHPVSRGPLRPAVSTAVHYLLLGSCWVLLRTRRYPVRPPNGTGHDD